ncbi:unnamed protein product [Amoebophrya sp. A120]|nr:unnamed protein product [Amoebophrya sp. A120]|eukprot:GSA120T00000332001.1
MLSSSRSRTNANSGRPNSGGAASFASAVPSRSASFQHTALAASSFHSIPPSSRPPADVDERGSGSSKNRRNCQNLSLSPDKGRQLSVRPRRGLSRSSTSSMIIEEGPSAASDAKHDDDMTTSRNASKSTTRKKQKKPIGCLSRLFLSVLGTFLPYRMHHQLKQQKAAKILKWWQLAPFAITLVGALGSSVLVLFRHYMQTCQMEAGLAFLGTTTASSIYGYHGSSSTLSIGSSTTPAPGSSAVPGTTTAEAVDAQATRSQVLTRHRTRRRILAEDHTSKSVESATAHDHVGVHPQLHHAELPSSAVGKQASSSSTSTTTSAIDARLVLDAAALQNDNDLAGGTSSGETEQSERTSTSIDNTSTTDTDGPPENENNPQVDHGDLPPHSHVGRACGMNAGDYGNFRQAHEGWSICSVRMLEPFWFEGDDETHFRTLFCQIHCTTDAEARQARESRAGVLGGASNYSGITDEAEASSEGSKQDNKVSATTSTTFAPSEEPFEHELHTDRYQTENTAQEDFVVLSENNVLTPGVDDIINAVPSPTCESYGAIDSWYNEGKDCFSERLPTHVLNEFKSYEMQKLLGVPPATTTYVYPSTSTSSSSTTSRRLDHGEQGRQSSSNGDDSFSTLSPASASGTSSSNPQQEPRRTRMPDCHGIGLVQKVKCPTWETALPNVLATFPYVEVMVVYACILLFMGIRRASCVGEFVTEFFGDPVDDLQAEVDELRQRLEKLEGKKKSSAEVEEGELQRNGNYFYPTGLVDQQQIQMQGSTIVDEHDPVLEDLAESATVMSHVSGRVVPARSASLEELVHSAGAARSRSQLNIFTRINSQETVDIDGFLLDEEQGERPQLEQMSSTNKKDPGTICSVGSVEMNRF